MNIWLLSQLPITTLVFTDFTPAPSVSITKKRTIFHIPDVHTESDSIDEIVAIVKAIVVMIQVKVDISQVSLNLT